MASNNPILSDHVLSRDEFIATGITTFELCDICLEGFDSGLHIPAQVGGLNTCNHIFGKSCLDIWIRSRNNNANTCPTCRDVLFRRHESQGESSEGEEEDEEDEVVEEEEEEEHEGYGDWPDSVRDITDPMHAFTLVKYLADGSLGDAYLTSAVMVQELLSEAYHHFGFKKDFALGEGGSRERVVIHRLIRASFATIISDERIRRFWVPKFAEAMQWSLDVDNGPDEVPSDDEDQDYEDYFPYGTGEYRDYDSMDEW